jgi:hypothetical protein
MHGYRLLMLTYKGFFNKMICLFAFWHHDLTLVLLWYSKLLNIYILIRLTEYISRGFRHFERRTLRLDRLKPIQQFLLHLLTRTLARKVKTFCLYFCGLQISSTEQSPISNNMSFQSVSQRVIREAPKTCESAHKPCIKIIMFRRRVWNED